MNLAKTIALSDARERYIYACLGQDEEEMAAAKEAIRLAHEIADEVAE